jgi:hypothetical protein
MGCNARKTNKQQTYYEINILSPGRVICDKAAGI